MVAYGKCKCGQTPYVATSTIALQRALRQYEIMHSSVVSREHVDVTRDTRHCPAGTADHVTCLRRRRPE